MDGIMEYCQLAEERRRGKIFCGPREFVVSGRDDRSGGPPPISVQVISALATGQRAQPEQLRGVGRLPRRCRNDDAANDQGYKMATLSCLCCSTL